MGIFGIHGLDATIPRKLLVARKPASSRSNRQMRSIFCRSVCSPALAARRRTTSHLTSAAFRAPRSQRLAAAYRSNSTTSWAHRILTFSLFDRERAKPVLICEALHAADLHHRLIGTQPGRASPSRLMHFAAIEISVTGMKDPAVTTDRSPPRHGPRCDPGAARGEIQAAGPRESRTASKPNQALALYAIATPLSDLAELGEGR